jgi:hypothetical protein
VRREFVLADGLFAVDELVDVELLALASPLALTFALGDVEFAAPLAVESAPFAVDSPWDTAPFVADVAVPVAPVALFVRLDVSVLPLAEPMALTGPAFAPAEPEAEPDPFAMPVA